jgi:hypothetical protein
MLPATNGPPGYKGEPYVPVAVSFGQLTGEPRRKVGHLDYALNRNFWRNIHQPTEKDRATLRRRVLEQIPEDLRKIEAGEDPPSLPEGQWRCAEVPLTVTQAGRWPLAIRSSLEGSCDPCLAEIEWNDAIGVHHVKEVLDPTQVERLLGTPGLAWRSRPVQGYAIFTHALRMLAPMKLRGRYFLAVLR